MVAADLAAGLLSSWGLQGQEILRVQGTRPWRAPSAATPGSTGTRWSSWPTTSPWRPAPAGAHRPGPRPGGLRHRPAIWPGALRAGGRRRPLHPGSAGVCRPVRLRRQRRHHRAAQAKRASSWRAGRSATATPTAGAARSPSSSGPRSSGSSPWRRTTCGSKALAAIDRVTWIPRWGRERIYHMVEHRPDWCISRQRAWGVPIVAFYCKACGEVLLDPGDPGGHHRPGARRRGRMSGSTRRPRTCCRRGPRCACGGRRLQEGDRHPGRLVRLRGELGRGAGTRPGPELCPPTSTWRAATSTAAGSTRSLLTSRGHPGPGPL